jgi:hypothetical protein
MQGCFFEEFAGPFPRPMEWGKPMAFRHAGFAKHRRPKAITTFACSIGTT